MLALTWHVYAIGCRLTCWVAGMAPPAPFDRPRKLVVRGPSRFVRNPMYSGAILALGGAAIVYPSVALLGYVLLFGGSTHLFVVSYEEPTLSRLFGADYQAYRSRVNRWLPGV